MKAPQVRRFSARRALTLIELVVVMVILAAVAGIVLPLLPNMLTRAHTSTTATNLGEIGKAIQTYEAVYQSYPNNFDSLIDNTGAIASYIRGNTGFDLTTTTPTQGTVDALSNAGINSVAQMATTGTGDFSPTFYPYGSVQTAVTPTTAISTSSTLAVLTGTAALREFNLSPGGTYVVFGLGSRTSMQGRTLQEAPVHFSDEASGAPNLAYARLGVIFQTAGLNTNGTNSTLDRARLVGVVCFSSDGVHGLNEHLKEYWNANKN